MRKTAAIVVALLAMLIAAFPTSANASGAHALIQGSGSSWAANAVNQWIADVHQNGLQVVFTPSGSAQGRKDYANKTVDFAVSDIGFLGKDPATGADDTPAGRSYAYLPIVAGGTALPYQIKKNGQLVRNLRLSGTTIAKIFTNQITNWDDPQITHDNNGNQMPNLPIIPVVHSEGSGSSYQFTRYLWRDYPSIWNPFGGNFATEYFPRQGNQVAENGSDSVMNFLTSTAANGAIGYDEYSYALGKNFPVVKVLNTAGYYTLPTQYNVAVALTKAQINTDASSPDYLLQNLDSVYSYNDPRVYPMSSYSYAIIPTASNDPTMTTAKRQTLVDYLYLSICQGQAQMGPIGYSPLPVNLVQASFDQVNKLKSADPNVDLGNENVTTCHNPTFVSGQPTRNYLAEIAPNPPACDKSSAGPCTGNGDTGTGNPANGGGTGGSTGGATGGTTGGTRSGTTGSAGKNGGQSAGGSSTKSPSAGTHIDPNTGQIVSDGGSFGDSGNNGPGDVALANSTNLAKSQSGGQEATLGAIAGLLLLALLIVPPLVAHTVDRKGKP